MLQVLLITTLALQLLLLKNGSVAFQSQSYRSTRCFSRLLVDENDNEVNDAQNTPTSKPRVNYRVRSVMQLITSRYKGTSSADQNNKVWTKTRNYVYHSSDKLTTEQVAQVLSFLDHVFPNDPQLAQTIVQSSPRILRKNVNSYLRPTAEFLQQLYGPDLFVEAVTRNPNLLLSTGVGYDAPKDGTSIENFLTESLHMTTTNVKKLKRTVPWIFQMSIAKMENQVNFWKEILEKGRKEEEKRKGKRIATTSKNNEEMVAKLLLSHPTLFHLSVETNLKPRLDFLANCCMLNDEDIVNLVKTSRGVTLGLSVEDNLQPTIDFLEEVLGDLGRLDKIDKLRKCILKHPQLLGLSIKNLKTKVFYFDAIDRLHYRNANNITLSTTSSLASKILLRSPAVFSLSLRENIVPTIEFLAKVWGCQAPKIELENGGDISMSIVKRGAVETKRATTFASVASLSSLIGEYPNILTLSLEGNIQPTINFYNQTGYIDVDSTWNLQQENRTSTGNQSIRESRRFTIIRGRYIAASLFNRLLPRWHYTISVKTHDKLDSENTLPLHVLANANDKAFSEYLGIDLDEYKLFVKESVPRLKFSAQFDTWLKTGRPIDV